VKFQSEARSVPGPHCFCDTIASMSRIECFMLTDTSRPISNPPVGAIWHCPWYAGMQIGYGGLTFDRYPDGLILCVQTPGGDWLIDGPSFVNRKESGFWSRTGIAPKLTVTPSIHIVGKYHGWLRDGYLIDC